jgi:hypothetical protein
MRSRRIKPAQAPQVFVISADVDHSRIAKSHGVNSVLPTFRPQTDADWPEANDVFLLDGYWWWRQVDTKGQTLHGPAVGPVPLALYPPIFDQSQVGQ